MSVNFGIVREITPRKPRNLFETLHPSLWAIIIASGLDNDLRDLYSLMGTNLYLKSLVPMCITHLTLPCCIPLAHLSALSRRFPHVDSMDFGGCIHAPRMLMIGNEADTKENETDETAFADTSFDMLNLYGCGQLSSSFLVSLIRPSIQKCTLTHLVLGGCMSKLTDELLRKLLEFPQEPAIVIPHVQDKIPTPQPTHITPPQHTIIDVSESPPTTLASQPSPQPFNPDQSQLLDEAGQNVVFVVRPPNSAQLTGRNTPVFYRPKPKHLPFRTSLSSSSNILTPYAYPPPQTSIPLSYGMLYSPPLPVQTTSPRPFSAHRFTPQPTNDTHEKTPESATIGHRKFNTPSPVPSLFYKTQSPQLVPPHSIRHLNLADGFKLTDKSAHLIATSLPNLEILFLGDCYGMTADGLTEIVSSCHQLKALSVDRCRCNSTVLQTIAKNCPQLMCLITGYISTNDLRCLASGCPQLKVLRLSYGNVLRCTRQTAMILSRLPNLQCLELSTNDSLSDFVDALCVDWEQMDVNEEDEDLLDRDGNAINPAERLAYYEVAAEDVLDERVRALLDDETNEDDVTTLRHIVEMQFDEEKRTLTNRMLKSQAQERCFERLLKEATQYEDRVPTPSPTGMKTMRYEDRDSPFTPPHASPTNISFPRPKNLMSRLSYLSFRDGLLTQDGLLHLALNGYNLQFLSFAGSVTFGEGRNNEHTPPSYLHSPLYSFAKYLRSDVGMQVFEFPRHIPLLHVEAFIHGAGENKQYDTVWKHVQRITLVDSEIDDRTLLSLLALFPFLTTIQLRDCPNIHPTVFVPSHYGTFSTVRQLDLFNSEKCTNNNLTELLLNPSVLPSLQRLFISSNTPCTEQAQTRSQNSSTPRCDFLPQQRPFLRVYKRSSCECFGDEGFQRGNHWW
ncbi:hypothetical protein BLNAU_1686 [Blattamonas nauphoetae]|uniref:Uncharacterized protein n=1 Tax=Blattamonas nauphoetae TaxID=2049346 RepID=A0ABQ9YHB7_9EUKA|nr:hypothetical protein BLNAU_1686 [Blattamonas nauphoetae]